MFTSRIVLICVLAMPWSVVMADEAEDRTREGFEALADGDQEKFFEHALKDAEEGLPEAQLMVGRCYEQGILGAPKDMNEAVKWYRLAAEQGQPDAQMRLADLYMTGTGVPRDQKAANEWLERAASQGSPKANDFLGDSYLAGRGVAKDPAKAATYYLKAAEANLASSQIKLAGMYIQGNGVPQDRGEGYFWLLVVQESPESAKFGNVKQLAANFGAKLNADERMEAERRAKDFLAAHAVTSTNAP